MTLTPAMKVIDLLGVVAQRAGKAPSRGDLFRVPAEVRKRQKPVKRALGPRPVGITTDDRTISGPSGDVMARVYRPAAPTGGAIVYIHGGGFVHGGVDACDHICADLCDLTGDVVASVDYRLAPEDPFPAGLDDCEAVFRWVVANAGDLGVDPARISVVGDSAGGNLSAALCLRMRDVAGPMPRTQVLVYPMLDLTCSRPSWVSQCRPYLDVADVIEIVGYYAGDAGPKDPLVSPLFADDLTGLPPALVVVAEHDTLRDDGLEYAEALRAAGVDTHVLDVDGMLHGYLSWPRLTRNYASTLRVIRDHVRRR